jgi:hypothetical protein
MAYFFRLFLTAHTVLSSVLNPKKENGRVLGAPLCEVLDCGSRWWLTGLFSPAEEERGLVW